MWIWWVIGYAVFIGGVLKLCREIHESDEKSHELSAGQFKKRKKSPKRAQHAVPLLVKRGRNFLRRSAR